MTEYTKVMVNPEDISAFIEHCKKVYSHTLSDAEATVCLNNLLDFYALLYPVE